MVRRTKAKAKAKTRAPGRKLGEAATLSHSLLQDWLAFLLDVGPTWLHVLIKLASCLCLRVTEACRLHKDDIDFKKRVIRVAPLKRQPEVLKPLLPECAQLFATLKKKGLSRKRAQRKGSRGQVTWQDRWPDDGSDGWLFPASHVRVHCMPNKILYQAGRNLRVQVFRWGDQVQARKLRLFLQQVSWDFVRAGAVARDGDVLVE
eukprot:s4728_g5.t1